MRLTDEQAEILTVEGDRVMLAPDDLPGQWEETF